VVVEKKKKRYHPTPPLLYLNLSGVVVVSELVLAKVLTIPLNLIYSYVVRHETLQEQLVFTVS
jgi:hypothetical protein